MQFESMHAFIYAIVGYFENLDLNLNSNRKSSKTRSALVAAWANKKLGGWHAPDPRWHRQHFPDTSSLFNNTLKHYLPNFFNFLTHLHFLHHSETLSSNLFKFSWQNRDSLNWDHQTELRVYSKYELFAPLFYQMKEQTLQQIQDPKL